MDAKKNRLFHYSLLLSRVHYDSGSTSWDAASLIFNNLPTFYVILRFTDCTCEFVHRLRNFRDVSYAPFPFFLFFKIQLFLDRLTIKNNVYVYVCLIKKEYLEILFCRNITVGFHLWLKKKCIDSNYRAYSK